jgi:formylglycine-generating enzyme required for sulfatase activity
MKPRLPFFFFFLLAALPAALRAQDCYCCIKQTSGQTAYDNGNYDKAIVEWTRASQTTDAAEKCPNLRALLANANKKQKEQEDRRRTQNAEAERQRKKNEDQARANQADDDLWDALKDGDAQLVQRYIDKCQACRHITAAQKRLKELTPVDTHPLVPAIPAWLAFVKGGSYTMGDVMGDNLQTDETPHTVTVSDFYISKYEVSFEEFDAFCTATGRTKPEDSGWGRGTRPVINVDWYDALEYCNWRSRQDGLTPCYTIDKTNQDPNNQNTGDTKKWTVTCSWTDNGYRLPTEAEWEYAAREGGKKVRFGNGRDLIDPTEINFDARSKYKKAFSVAGEYCQKTVPVGDLSANALGLKNMSGNVWEWCWDWYGDKYYAESEGARNPRGATSSNYRVLRGGSWFDVPEYCRASFRYWYYPILRPYSLGFRLARGY